MTEKPNLVGETEKVDTLNAEKKSKHLLCLCKVDRVKGFPSFTTADFCLLGLTALNRSFTFCNSGFFDGRLLPDPQLGPVTEARLLIFTFHRELSGCLAVHNFSETDFPVSLK